MPARDIDRPLTVGEHLISSDVVRAAREWCARQTRFEFWEFRLGFWEFRRQALGCLVPMSAEDRVADRLLQRFRKVGLIAWRGGKWWPVATPTIFTNSQD